MAGEYLIPSGPKNLKTIFPTVDWSKLGDYYIQAVSQRVVIAQTPVMKLACCCGEDNVNIHFLNYCGKFDVMPFAKPIIIHEVKSQTFIKSLSSPLDKKDTGQERFDIRPNDTIELKNTCFKERDMTWVQEIFDSPKAYLQWQGIEGQEDNFIPIVAIDGTLERLKNVRDFIYEITLKVRLSNEFITIRN